MGNASSVQDIKLGDKIGDGSCGEVFKAVWSGKQVAAKRFCAVFFEGDYDGSIRAAFLEKFKSEWELLSNLKHPNIVQYYTVILPPPPETPIIVTELLVCDLAKHIRDSRSKPKVSFSEVVKIMLDVAEALHYLHSQKPSIVHRNLTSKNVLLTKSLHAKIAGFGVAKVFPHGAMYATPIPGTPVYAAPETYPKKMGRTQKGRIAIYSEKIDIYSFGALMLETIIGHLPKRILPDPVLEDGEIVPEYIRRREDLEEMGPYHPLHNLVCQCFENIPEKRPSATEIINSLLKFTKERQRSPRHEVLDPVVIVLENTNASHSKTGNNSAVDGESSRKIKNLEKHKVRRRDKVPREIKAQGPEAKLAYGNALKTGKVKVYRARIMLIGQERAGKTSLKKAFLGLAFDPEEDSTDGIEVDPSKLEVDIDQVRNWKLTDKKLSVSQFALDLAKMVAKEIQERDKDKEVSQEDDEEDSDDDHEKGREKQREKKSKLDDYKSKRDDPDEDTNKQTKMDQSGLNSPGEPLLSKPLVVNSQMNQDTSRNASKETKADAPVVELNIDATSPPEEFTDYLDQLLKGLNLQTDATAVEHHMILDLWDFAGQQLYYASYPVFLSPRAVYMLVYDLSKGLNDPAQPYFQQGNRKIRLTNPNKETNLENLLAWLVSVSSICSSESERAVKDQPHCRPPVFIVGTHADEQHQEDIDKIELQITTEIFENSENVIRPIFSVDNTQGSSDRGVSALQKRVIEVLKQEPYMGEEIPIRWFNFEKVVKALVAKKVYHLNMEELQTIIQKHCFIESKDEVATMLNFYHDVGVIVKHGNTVILQTEWLIKLFKQLITVRCFDDMEPRHCKLWKEMEKTGVLDMELVEHVFSEFCEQGVIKEDILEMMMKFGLIVQFALSPTEKKYFVPCQLRSPPDILCKEEPSPGDPCPLYLDFQRMGYVPHGLYLQLVSRCTKWCSTSGFREPPELYDGASLFFIGKELTHHMMLVYKKRFIKIVLKQIKRNDGSSCEPVSAKEVPILVRTFLNEMMQNLPEALPWFKNVAYELCVKCPYCLKVEKPCDNHDQFPCHDERCLCLKTVAPDGSCRYCTESHLGEILPLPELKRWFSSSSEDSSIKDTSEEEVETHTVSKKKLPCSIRQLPDKKDYQVKEGFPSDCDLELLSAKVEKWKTLGRRLKIEAAELTALDKDNEEWSEKAFAMLIKWKRKKGSKATYRCLYDALCHKLMNRTDLAEEFCCSLSKPEG